MIVLAARIKKHTSPLSDQWGEKFFISNNFLLEILVKWCTIFQYFILDWAKRQTNLAEAEPKANQSEIDADEILETPAEEKIPESKTTEVKMDVEESEVEDEDTDGIISTVFFLKKHMV